MKWPFIPRNRLSELVNQAIQSSPVTAILGPRQCGKTRLARSLQIPESNYFDLENYVDLVRLDDNPMTALGRLSGIVVIDEIQRKPELFPHLRVLADRDETPARFVILGSASPALMKSASESLAGRVSFIDMSGFHLGEIEANQWEELWLKGGYPRSFLVDEPISFKWRLDYLRTLIARDLREIAESRLSEEQLRKLLILIAQCHGQSWNHSRAGDILGVTYKTVQRHIEILKGAFLIRELPPYFANVSKRLKKAPKVYLRDTGLLNALLSIREPRNLRSHPSVGSSWEGFAMEQLIRFLEFRDEDCFSYSVQSGTEIDLVIPRSGKLWGFEFKANDAPKRTRSMIEGINDLELEKLFVIHPGLRDYGLSDEIDAVSIQNLLGISSIMGV